MDRLYPEDTYTQYVGIEQLRWPIPIAPDNSSTGCNCEPLGKRDKEHRVFMEDPASKSTIYIREVFFEAIDELTDYRIVFFYKDPKPTILGKHVKITAWAPQLRLLAHPKTKVFLTHSGLKSSVHDDARRDDADVRGAVAQRKFALSLGIGTVLNKFTLTKERIVTELMEKLYVIFLDRPMPALGRADFHVARQMRHKDRRVFFKRRAIQQILVEYHSIDLVAGILVFVYVFSK